MRGLRKLKPLRNLVYVEKVVETVSKGGIVLPQTFKARGPGSRMQAVGDHFRAKVLAVGPEASRDVHVGDEALVYTFAEGDGSTLYTGESDDGARADKAARLFVRYPDDFVCVIVQEKPAATSKDAMLGGLLG